MLKARFAKYLLLSLMIFLITGRISNAQIAPDSLGFILKFVDVTDPTTSTKVQFNILPSISATATNISWDFGDGNSSIETSPLHTYDITVKDSFIVVLNLTLAQDTTFTRKIKVSSAFFVIEEDQSIKNIASYKKVFRGGYEYNVNSNMRFEWDIDGNIIDNPENFPRIYYTFDQGGIYKVSLKTWNIADPAKSVSFSRFVNILPVFGATKETFSNIPNVFTPNGDMVHDYFEVPSSGTSRLKFMVYSRAGAMVYQNEANIIKWDGKNVYGKELPEGIYYYIIEDLDGKYENTKGFFYIFRGK